MNENIEDSKNVLKSLIQCTKDVQFAQQNEVQGITVSFYNKMLSSAQAILLLSEDYYNACILSSHMLEGLILLTWILDNPKTRIKQYVDYGAVEQLVGLHVYPEQKETLLQAIKQRNIQRLLKAEFKNVELTDEILLNPDNYYNIWYRPEAKSIWNIVELLTTETRHQEISNIKFMYDRLCSYKHYSPYVILPRYGMNCVKYNPDEFIALSITLQALYISFIYVNQNQPESINIDDITQQYNKILGINWMPSI